MFYTMKYTKILLISLFIWAGIFISDAQNNVTITDDESHNADASAMLDVYSTSKGMLIPRMTTVQIGMISNPATGLLVFDIDLLSFFFFDGSLWQDLSGQGGSLWSVNETTGDIYLNNLDINVGIGTDNPLSKLAVVANSGANPGDPLFEIQDEFGLPIFSVTSEGVRIYVKDVDSKGVSGGFAVGRYGAAKGIPDTTFFLVTADSTRVYMQESTGKGVSGGFAVGRYGAAKGTEEYFRVTPDSTRVYTTDPGKGVSGGFAVGRYGAAKGVTENYMHITPENYLIGHRAGDSITSGLYNIFFGYESGISDTSGSNNVFVGHNTGYKNKAGNYNVFLGNEAGYNNSDGYSNTFLGTFSGQGNSDGANNTYIGENAGQSMISGQRNTFLGSQAGQLALSGNYNLFMGFNAGRSHNSGNNNVYLGYEAGSGGLSGNEDGISNVFIGTESGTDNTSGQYNAFLGYRTGYENTTGGHNIFVGYQSGRDNSTGWTNICVGSWAGANNETGSDNVFIGGSSGYYNTHSLRNTYIGFYTGQNNYGTDNVFIGNEAGRYNNQSNRLIIDNTDNANPLIYGQFDYDRIGINDNNPSANLHIKQVGATEEGLAIENNENTNTWAWEVMSTFLGLYYNSSLVGYWNDATGAYAAISDKKLKKDIEYIDYDILDRIMKLKPAKYRLLHADENDQKNIGFIAQEVQEYFPDLIYQETEESFIGLHYPDFGILAIKAIQEQQVIITEQEKRIRKLEENKKDNDKIEQLEKNNIELHKELNKLKDDNSELNKKIDEIFKLIEK